MEICKGDVSGDAPGFRGCESNHPAGVVLIKISNNSRLSFSRRFIKTAGSRC
jgi:hypothetical protein